LALVRILFFSDPAVLPNPIIPPLRLEPGATTLKIGRSLLFFGPPHFSIYVLPFWPSPGFLAPSFKTGHPPPRSNPILFFKIPGCTLFVLFGVQPFNFSFPGPIPVFFPPRDEACKCWDGQEFRTTPPLQSKSFSLFRLSPPL